MVSMSVGLMIIIVVVLGAVLKVDVRRRPSFLLYCRLPPASAALDPLKFSTAGFRSIISFMVSRDNQSWIKVMEVCP